RPWFRLRRRLALRRCLVGRAQRGVARGLRHRYRHDHGLVLPAAMSRAAARETPEQQDQNRATDQTAMFSYVTRTWSSRAVAEHGCVPKQVVNVTLPVPPQGSCNARGIVLRTPYDVNPTTWRLSAPNSAQISCALEPVYPPPDRTGSMVTD